MPVGRALEWATTGTTFATANGMNRIGAALVIAALCSGPPACNRAAADDADVARHVMRLTAFDFPESVRYDPQQDVYFISNILGYGSVKDGEAYITRVNARDLRRSDVFIRSGFNGVLLDAPKGMAIQGDTLWVADIHAIRGFHRLTGAPVGEIDVHPYDVVMLNDLALGPDGALYATDTGIVMSRVGVAYHNTGQILKIAPGRQVSIFAKMKELQHPNGIVWDSASKSFAIVTFHPSSSELYLLGMDRRKQTLITGLGRFDGVVSLHDGRYILTSWSDSSVQMVQNGRTWRIIDDVWQGADLGFDTKRNRIAVPQVLQGRVDIWQLPN
jgi:sugar lactone lactonase YvrE